MLKDYLIYYLIFLGVVSIVTFILYKIDKVKAMNKKFRIPEFTLLGFGVLGGSFGALLGMQIFKHKTKKYYFYLINCLGLVAQVLILVFLFII